MVSNTYFKTILTTALLITIASAISIQIYGFEEEGIRILIRWSAKLAATFFSIAFAASGLHYFINGKASTWILLKRPHFGLAFGVSHTFHLAFLIWLQISLHPVFTLANKVSLAGGSMAYLFMYIMMVTTFPYFKSKLKPKTWTLLHTVGAYWIWFIFFRSYFKNVVNKDQYYILFLLLLIVVIIRLSKFIHQQYKRRG